MQGYDVRPLEDKEKQLRSYSTLFFKAEKKHDVLYIGDTPPLQAVAVQQPALMKTEPAAGRGSMFHTPPSPPGPGLGILNFLVTDNLQIQEEKKRERNINVNVDNHSCNCKCVIL